MCDHHRLDVSRRRFALGAVPLCVGALAQRAFAQAGASPPNAVSPDEALRRLMEGNQRYAANNSVIKDFAAGRAARATAQYPFAAVLGCADSRVAPELAFDQGPGEVFVVRLAGNFVNDDGLASLEYGVRFLGVPLIMVLGHSNCGAVDATIKVLKDDAKLPGHLPELGSSIKPAVEAARKTNASNLLEEAIAENVRHNVARLRDAKPIISEAVTARKIRVVGGVYDLATGVVKLV
jgi:carbonic anhydrase